MVNLSELKRYHLFIDASYYPDHTFLGDFDSFDEINAFLKKRVEQRNASCKSAYGIVGMGDMSPAGLDATGGEDPEDECIEFLGNFTEAEFKENEEWLREAEESAKAEYGDGVWLSTVYSEDPEVVMDAEEYGVWDHVEQIWYGNDDDRILDGRDWDKGSGSSIPAEDYNREKAA